MHFPQTVVPKFIFNTENLNQRVNKFKLMVIRQNDYSCYVLCLHRQMASSIYLIPSYTFTNPKSFK